MTLFKHELRRGRTALIVWTAAIAFLFAICIFIFPDMKSQTEGLNEVFASMGGFTAALGMDQVNFGTLTGFYAIECGNILGLGGAFYAALCAVGALSKEEKEKTAEFLLMHPISRSRIVTDKLLAVLAQIVLLNAAVYALSVGSIACIGEAVPWKEVSLLHLAYLILQLELTGICFGMSACLRSGGLGAGLGLAAVMYFLNIIANLSELAEFLRYITPFAYADGADIVTNCSLNAGLVALGIAYGIIGVGLAYWKYCRKDIM